MFSIGHAHLGKQRLRLAARRNGFRFTVGLILSALFAVNVVVTFVSSSRPIVATPLDRRNLVAAVFSGVLFAASRPGIAEDNAGSDVVAVAKQPGELAIEAFLKTLPVYAVTDPTGAPVLQQGKEGSRSGKLFLSQADADAALVGYKAVQGSSSNKLEVRELAMSEVYLPLVARPNTEALGGRFQVLPFAEELRNAKRILKVPSLGPYEADTVPLFFSSLLAVEQTDGKDVRVPAFLHEDDLRAALRRARSDGDKEDIVVTTLQRVVEELAAGTPEDSGLASQLLAVPDKRDIGLGDWGGATVREVVRASGRR